MDTRSTRARSVCAMRQKRSNNGRCVCPHLCLNSARRLVAPSWRVVSWPLDMVAKKIHAKIWPPDMVATKCFPSPLRADWLWRHTQTQRDADRHKRTHRDTEATDTHRDTPTIFDTAKHNNHFLRTAKHDDFFLTGSFFDTAQAKSKTATIF